MPPCKSNVIVTVVEARDMPETQSIGKQDPYCNVHVGGFKEKTQVLKDGGSYAWWNERFEFRLGNQITEVQFHIRNSNRLANSDIGTAQVSLQQVLDCVNAEFDGTLPITSSSGKPMGVLHVKVAVTGERKEQHAAKHQGGEGAAPVESATPSTAPVSATRPFCRICGNSDLSGGNFCNRCGERISSASVVGSGAGAAGAAAGVATADVAGVGGARARGGGGGS